jgi:hypothetical protein
MADQYQQPFGKQLIPGDQWLWTVSLPDYPPSQFTLKYAFRGPKVNGPGLLDITATTATNGSDFSLTVAPADTEVLDPGFYGWGMLVFDGSNNRTELARGTVELIPDLVAQDGGYDPRTFELRMLGALEALLLNVAARVEDEYQINGRMLRITPRDKLLMMRDDFVSRVRRQQIECGELPPQTNQVQGAFGDASNPVLVRLWKNFPGNSA